jgi:hypothetical protein
VLTPAALIVVKAFSDGVGLGGVGSFLEAAKLAIGKRMRNMSKCRESFIVYPLVKVTI